MGGVGGIGGLGGVSSVFGNGYGDKVLGVARANLIGYFVQDERGGSVSHDYSALQHDGAYTGVSLGAAGIGDGRTCPLFDGANDFNDIYNVYKIFDAVENLITNPSVETNTTGYASGTNTSIERSTDQAKFGSSSLKITWDGGGAGRAFLSGTLTLNDALHSVFIWLYIPSAYSGTALRLDFINFAGQGGTTLKTADMGLRDQWQQVAIEGFNPDAGDLIGNIQLQELGDTPANGDIVYVDGSQLEERATVTDYTDGSLGERYSWQGTAHASKSDRESGAVEGGMLVWFAADDWDAGGIDYALNLGVDATTNFININKAADGTIIFYYEAGNAIDSVTSAVQTDDGVFKCCLLTWSSAADELQGFLGGAQVSTTQTGLGTWAGSLASTRALVGASVTTPSNVLAGKAAHAALWAGSSAPALLQAAAAQLAVV